MADHLRLAVDNSGGGFVVRAKKPGIKRYALVGANLTQLLVNREAVGEPAERPPVTYPGRPHAKSLSNRRRASKSINGIGNSHHAMQNNPSCLDLSTGLNVGQISGTENGIIPPMTMIAQPMPERHPRHIESIAARLLALRLAHDLSQREFCDRVGIGTTTYNNWERGISRPELDKAMQICDAFQVTLDWIYRGNLAGMPFNVAERLERGRKAVGQ